MVSRIKLWLTEAQFDEITSALDVHEQECVDRNEPRRVEVIGQVVAKLHAARRRAGEAQP